MKIFLKKKINFKNLVLFVDVEFNLIEPCKLIFEFCTCTHSFIAGIRLINKHLRMNVELMNRMELMFERSWSRESSETESMLTIVCHS